jgi:hypothetical protein
MRGLGFLHGWIGRFQFRGALADLRYFLRHREPHQVYIAMGAVALTALTIAAFVVDSRFEPDYHPDIVYVQQWPLSRTDAQIIAQQKIDYVIKARRLEAEKRAAAQRQAGFQHIQNAMDAWDLK